MTTRASAAPATAPIVTGCEVCADMRTVLNPGWDGLYVELAQVYPDGTDNLPAGDLEWIAEMRQEAQRQHGPEWLPCPQCQPQGKRGRR